MTPNKIAVTGGLGSGKSAFCDILREMGYPVYSCDEINRELFTDENYRQDLSRMFPDCLTDGTIDKNKLSRKVFSDSSALEALNAFSHPRIMKRLLAHMNAVKGVVFAEVPLLFEGGYETLFDAVIGLRRSQEARIQAVFHRDGLCRDEAVSRMQSQFDPAMLKSKNCIVVENDQDIGALYEKAKTVLRTLGIEQL